VTNLDPTCLFCRVGTGELEVSLVAANDAAVAFLDLHPHAPGHTLVVPRVHAPTLAELPASVVGPLFSLVQETARLLAERLEAPGMTFGINQGIIAGQGVPHLHVHLMPRFANDGGSSIHAVVKNTPSEEERDHISSLLTLS
jgi:histidine triad (HIT) family protein